MGITFSETPTMFGPLHIAILLGVLLGTAGVFCLLRNRSERTLQRFIFVLGVSMLLAEVWKQWFVPRYVYTDAPSMWFFPWQLCDMAMYVAALLPLLGGRAREAGLVFLSTSSLLAAAVALLIPADMLRPQIWLFWHGFLYHAAMVQLAVAALLLLKKRPKAPFWPALLLFCGMAAVAEGINVLSHRWIGDIRREANMFYITPYYPSTQPIVHEVAVAWGIWPAVVLYLCAITLGSFGLYALEAALLWRKGRLS